MTLLMIVISLAAAKDKIKWEELVARHLESIGTAEARAMVKTRAMNGKASVASLLGNPGRMSGLGSILSNERMTSISMNFGHRDYPGEYHAFDGKDVTVGVVRPGQRSSLSQFIHDHEFLLREGLVSGVMSTSWCLYEVKERRPKLNYDGLKKIEGTKLHRLRYRPRKGAEDARVLLYFQPDTYRHVLSTYSWSVSANMGSMPAYSPQQREIHIKITEKYDNFKQVDGLTLPHLYKLIFSYEGQSRTILTEFSIEVDETFQNIPADLKAFRVE
jgi:hypothetical protein